ncbi:MAG: hypothetical protein Q9208_007524 [Pyrenodesmia sp. 3 TL-2023]
MDTLPMDKINIGGMTGQDVRSTDPEQGKGNLTIPNHGGTDVDLIRCLEQANADWKVDGHDPEFSCAREPPIPGIDQENEKDVDVQDKDSRDGQARLPHTNDWMIPPLPEEAAAAE